tara:strand:- start:24250 stop:25626 length:1377 start_codon:yes stop_codon:yes gene_type:complete
MNIEKIDQKHPHYDMYREHRRTGQLLEGGTVAMRKNRNETLPKEPREKGDNYQARVNRSVLLEAYTDTLSQMSLKPLTQSVKFTLDTLPDDWEWLQNDIDGSGSDVDTKALSAIRGRLSNGPWLALLDMPSTTDEDGRQLSDVELRQQGRHPYVSEIHPDSLINWEYGDDGKFVMIRIKYTSMETVEGEVTEVEYIKEWTTAEINLYRKAKDDEGKETWQLVKDKSGPNQIGVVPLAVCGELDDRPILEGLAHLNMSHFRKKSDLDNIIHLSCVPILHMAGFEKGDFSEKEISVSNAFVSSEKDSVIKWVEVQGTAIEQARHDIERTEAQMSVYGFEIVSEKQVQKTATETVKDDSDDTSVLQAVCTSVENTFDEIMEFASMYTGKPVPDDLRIQIFKDFNISYQVYQKIRALLDLRVAGEISRPTFHKELDRLKFLGDHYDPETEAGLIDDNPEVEV